MRPLSYILRGESPGSICREAISLLRRRWRRRQFSRLLASLDTPVTLRVLPYFRPDSKLTIDSTFVRPILAFADLICAGQFPFLGYGTQQLGLPPNWNLDFISGGEWTAGKSRPATLMQGSDPKVPWELSRLQFLPVLGKAYRITGDRSYAEAGERLLQDWVRNNPTGKAINWANAMEPALRAVSICLYLSLTFREDEPQPEWITRSLWEHLIFIETYLEYSYRFRGNHYLSNLLGLLCLSVFLDGAGMETRRAKYIEALEEEMRNQIYADGADYEASSGYHVFVTQIFTAALLFARAAQLHFSEEFNNRLSAMYEFTSALACGSGHLPHIGDCDDGRVELTVDDIEQMLWLPTGERHSLRVAGHLGIGEWIAGKPLGGRVEDALWHGVSTDGALEQFAPRQLRVFPLAGIAVAHSKDCAVIFLAQPNGLRGKGSHTHNDKLSILVSVKGVDLFCDSGTGTYTRDTVLRNRLRSTAAHNTFMADGVEQNRISADPKWTFCIGDEAAVSKIECAESPRQITLEAAHSGYRALGVIHRRRLFLEADQLRIEDEFDAQGEHSYTAFYHLSPEWRLGTMQQESDSSVVLYLQGPSSAIFRLSASGAINVRVEEAPISRAYGSMIAAPCLVMTARRARSFQSLACLSWLESPSPGTPVNRPPD